VAQAKPQIKEDEWADSDLFYASCVDFWGEDMNSPTKNIATSSSNLNGFLSTGRPE
jgi:hypothetical protein